MYKIVAKVLTNRLKVVLPDTINLVQYAFLKGGVILDNILIANELLYRLKSHKSKANLMVLKLDLSKAYDPVEWSFLIQVMQMFGSSKKWHRLISNVFLLPPFNFSLMVLLEFNLELPKVWDKEIQNPHTSFFHV